MHARDHSLNSFTQLRIVHRDIGLQPLVVVPGRLSGRLPFLDLGRNVRALYLGDDVTERLVAGVQGLVQIEIGVRQTGKPVVCRMKQDSPPDDAGVKRGARHLVFPRRWIVE